MATIAPAFVTVNPSFIEPELVVDYNQASAAFDLLPEMKPRVRLGDIDHAVYAKRISVRTQVAAAQSAQNSLPSCTTVTQLLGTATYLLRVRSQYDSHDVAAAASWDFSIVESQRLAMRQGMFQLSRSGLLYGFNPANGEGLLNAQGAMAVNLPADSFGNSTITSYDPGQLAFFFTNQIGAIKARTNQSGLPCKFTILMPQRVGQIMEWADIVQLTQFQRIGAGTMTTSGTIKEIAKMNGDEVRWGYDDTLQGKGAGGNDAIVIAMPELNKPGLPGINTNEFAKLTPGMSACTAMYANYDAPVEWTTQGHEGSLVNVLQEWRITSGWGIRAESITVISAAFS